MEEKNIYNSDNEMVISVGDFVAELSCVFDNIFYTINAETGALETLSTKCAIFDKLGQIKFKYFTDEEKAQIDKYTSPDNIFILVYDEHDPSHYAVTCLTVKELTSAIQNAYLEGKFAKQDVYKLLKDAQNSVCSKSGSGKYILKLCNIYKSLTHHLKTLTIYNLLDQTASEQLELLLSPSQTLPV